MTCNRGWVFENLAIRFGTRLPRQRVQAKYEFAVAWTEALTFMQGNNFFAFTAWRKFYHGQNSLNARFISVSIFVSFATSEGTKRFTGAQFVSTAADMDDRTISVAPCQQRTLWI